VADLEQALRTTQRSSDHITHMASVRDWCSLLVFCRALKPAYGDIKDCAREVIVTRHWMTAAILLMAAELNGTQALAQDYPTRPVTVIIPFAAGGPADITGRIVADIFSRHLGQRFVVENVGGAGGTIGALRAARAAADGYTILFGHMGTNALASAFYPTMGYDPQKDFEPIGLTAEYPELLVVRNDFPAKKNVVLLIRPSRRSENLNDFCTSPLISALCAPHKIVFGISKIAIEELTRLEGLWSIKNAATQGRRAGTSETSPTAPEAR
jgi:hypothetical protein